jgi:hypothetical protein
MQRELASHTDFNNSLIGPVSVWLPKDPDLEFALSGLQIDIGVARDLELIRRRQFELAGLAGLREYFEKKLIIANLQTALLVEKNAPTLFDGGQIHIPKVPSGTEEDWSRTEGV